MDEIDIKILSILQKNARATASEIGTTIGMSVSAVIERIKKMEGSGIIEQYTVIINHKNVNKDITAFISISLEHPKYNEGFLSYVENMHDVLEAHYLAGEYDYIIKVVTDTTTTLEMLLRDIKCIPGVSRTCTSMVLSTVKNDHSINPISIAEC